MARVALIGLEQTAAGQICSALAEYNHQIIRYQEQDVTIPELLDLDFVFAGGQPLDYLPLLKRVREVRPVMPFVVITGSSDTFEWLNALESGATDYCSAPIEPRQLHWMLERTQPRPRFGASRTVSQPAPEMRTNCQPVRIWIVNDDKAREVDLFRSALRRAGLRFELLAIGNGAEALGLIRLEAASGGPSVPDLMVLDSSLSEADGIEILEAMRQRNVPVVMTSSLISPSDRAKSVEEFFRMAAAVKEVLSLC